MSSHALSHRVRRRVLVVGVLVYLSALSVGFFAAASLRAGHPVHRYLVFNLVLAWIPLGLGLVLRRWLAGHRWSGVPAIALSAAWLVFLPNSFYMISDLAHLQSVTGPHAQFDVVMFSSFAATGVLVGYASLTLVHRELHRRLPTGPSTLIVATVLLLCSFGIYLGRVLRWNSWDVVTHPGTLLAQATGSGMHPFTDPQAFWVTGTFFALLASFYVAGWTASKVV
jgi:uncharacterized membrane protein